ncbi:erythroblast NAD(P)(+)--arginine ADP-ribosyltransferase-like [Acipenser oxyrinchus oxyrinchus]|uniref:NAD(P)(+)--arginine ADP-ribosyltransferase n=1 Tax=Acipenser oxyrinchus oxyrinchus TaxID=40147 RepID=A0AAD8CG51_ACIOX|nr:erythroblast NAD(P)(+)--arginine ADP-ribosyltransferase-like [Acipenser oxyrinchus oxyrinchus]
MKPPALSILLLSAAALLELPQIQCDPTTIPMNMAVNATDDQYDGCRDTMLKNVKKTLLPSELDKNPKFKNAWKTAQDKMMKQDHTGLSLDQATAIYLYTMDDVHKDFNRAVKTGGTNYSQFQFKAWHFHLTDALNTLKSNKLKCYDVFRGDELRFTAVKDAIVRFGQFASTSVNKHVAESFGTGTLFTIRTCLGVSIKKYSAFSNEKEVLIPPFEKFKVMEVHGKEIRLENIEDKKSNFNCRGGATVFKIQHTLTVSCVIWPLIVMQML